ncbi:hypothetical protein B296_00016934 [Ensete ventricosum]|uniref:Uncharacterized protein n=1 Tax=Ensete ventricosum TaxID=4639 RepID=A0A426YSA7_ENSVE|nr:hypothetical protein B296_00016934 [Ensete ventricosum]
MGPPCPTSEVGCWSGEVRFGRRHLSSGRELAYARRSGRVSSRRDPSDGQVSAIVDFAIPLLRRGAEAFIVSVVGHSYLISLLPLLVTMSSYLSTMPVILAVRRAPAGEGCRPYLSWGLGNLNGAGDDQTEDLSERVNSGTNPEDLIERVNSGTNRGDLVERVNLGTNPGDLAERVNSGTNLEDSAERVNSGTNRGDLTERVNLGINPEDLIGRVNSGTNPEV